MITVVDRKQRSTETASTDDQARAAGDALDRLIGVGATLRARLDELCGQYGVTCTGFEVLRILRASAPGLPRREIAQRLTSRAPDVTRLVDRLEREGLVKRARVVEDRRLSVTRITPKGTSLVERIEPAVEEYRARISPKLTKAEWQELSRLSVRIVDEPESS